MSHSKLLPSYPPTIIIWRADEKLPVTRACGCVGLSRAAYYRKPMDQSKRDAPVVDVLNQIVAKHGRWGFGLCFSWMRNNGYICGTTSGSGGFTRTCG